MIQSTGIEIRAKNEKIPDLSKFVGNSMLKFGLDDYQQTQVQLAVEEAVSNIIIHGNLEKSDKITIKCHKKDKEVEIIILNQGIQFNPCKLPKSKKNSYFNKKSGSMRVYFTNKYMNKVDYEFKDGNNILTLIKRI